MNEPLLNPDNPKSWEEWIKRGHNEEDKENRRKLLIWYKAQNKTPKTEPSAFSDFPDNSQVEEVLRFPVSGAKEMVEWLKDKVAKVPELQTEALFWAKELEPVSIKPQRREQ